MELTEQQLPPYRSEAQPLAFRFNGTRYQPARKPELVTRVSEGVSLRVTPGGAPSLRMDS